MITHSVFFNLQHAKDSVEETHFLEKAIGLSAISSVQNFDFVHEVSPKNNFSYGLIMQFDDQSGYDFYNNHPDHISFVEKTWMPEVEDFIEIDYVK